MVEKMESMSTDITTYLENLIDDIFHTVIPADQLDYSIAYVDSDVCFKFVVEYEELTDTDKIKINNEIIMNRFDILLYKLKRNLYMSYENYVFSVKFEESTIHKTHKDKIIIFITYEKIIGGSYIQDVPKEVQLIIANKVDIDTLRNYLSHLHYNEFSDGDFKVALHKLYPKIHDDLVTLIKTYPELNVKGIWHKLYVSTRDYTDSNEVPELYPIYDISDDCLYFNITDAQAVVLSMRYKYLYPKFYESMFSFYLKWNMTINEWISSIKILINECYETADDKYIKSLNDLCSGSNSEQLWYFYGDNAYFNINESSLIWYIISIPNASWKPSQIPYKYHRDLLSFLQSKDGSLSWVKQLSDKHLEYLNKVDNVVRSPTIFEALVKERNIRNL